MINKSIATINTRRGSTAFTVKHLLLAVSLLSLMGISLGAWQIYHSVSEQYEPGIMPLSAEIEEKFGVRFTFVAVTARGGMVELRYRVIDEGKAANFGHYSETAPMLIAEDSGKVVDVTIMGLHNHRVEPGRMYYVLYRNTEKAIESNRPVTIAIGDLKLEHVVVW